MSDYLDLEDPFADFTQDEWETLESYAIAATQSSQSPAQRSPSARVASFQTPFPPVQEEPTIDEDYEQFNVDDEDLLFEEAPADPLAHQPATQPQSFLLSQFNSLNAEIIRLKAERDKFETLAYNQDGKVDHLQKSLAKARTEHAAAINRITQTSEAEKGKLLNDIAEMEAKMRALSAEVEFQKSELQQAREKDVGVIRVGTASATMPEASPKRARVVKGSGIKSPEKGKIGGAQAFAKDEPIGNLKEKKRKREEPLKMNVPSSQLAMNGKPDEWASTEILELIVRRGRCGRSDGRFEVWLFRALLLI